MRIPKSHPGSYLRLLLPLLGALALFTGAATAWALQFDRTVVAQYAETAYGSGSAIRLQRWFTLLDSIAAKPDTRVQLAAVNEFWNRNIREGTDKAIWKKEDYWATPLETLAKGMADCEDFVIGKYFSLVHLGVPPEKLRLIYVRARVGQQSIAHMVLGYYPALDADPLVLDNLTSTIAPAGRRPDLSPVFSFNAENVYVGANTSGGVDRITRWQSVLSRMRQEGFQP